jgi:hypothetical protein
LKPENVLYDEETKKICLIDFGHAHQGLPPVKERPLILRDYGGTEAFKSPERKASGKVSLASEVYSIGLIWYQLLTGEKVEHKEKAVFNLEHLTNVSDDTYELITATLEKKPQDRITLRDLINDEYFNEYTEEEKQIIQGFGWFQDSCYVDSLLMILLFSCDDFWHQGMLEADVTTINRPLRCERTEIDILDVQEANRYRREVQDQLKAEWRALLELENLSEDEDEEEEEIQRTTCTLFRKLVARCLPSTRERTRRGGEIFVMYGAPEFYDKLTDIFPGISLNVTTYNVLTNERRVENAFKSWIPFNQYLEAAPTAKEAREGTRDRWTVDWSAINLPVLVFANIASPRFSIVDAPGDESGEVNQKPWAGTKVRAFGITILNGAYTLIGVITLQGVQPHASGGVHYVSYFRADDGNWYYYNDLKAGKATSIRTLPRVGVWEEANLSMPAMFFYARTENVPIATEETNVFMGSFLKPTEALNLRYHPITELPEPILEARNKRVAELLIFCRDYQSDWRTYFLSVKILDVALSSDTDFIGYDTKLSVVCYLLAAKLYHPPTAENFKDLVSWAGVETGKLILLEARIYRALCFDANFSTAYDYFQLLNGTPRQLLDLRILIRTQLIYKMTDHQLAVLVKRGLLREHRALREAEYWEELDTIELEPISP